MNSIKLGSLATWFLFALLVLVFSSCSNNSPSAASAPSCAASGAKTVANPTTPSGGNAFTVTVNGNQCGASQYPNQPCASITICTQGTSTCQTINNILIDTGSYGLRLFSSLLTSVSPAPIACSDSGTLAECVIFGDGSSEWGQVGVADVKLGNEPAVTVPVHLINSNYPGVPGMCSASQSVPDTDPGETNFNGILGIGLLGQDCGSDCTTSTDSQLYYSCQGNTCNPAVVAINSQVTNPVSALPTDNNGIIFDFHTASIGANGAANVTGQVIIGIGTQSNNMPAGGLQTLIPTFNDTIGTNTIPVVFPAYSSSPVPGFIDSGTNFFGLPTPSSPFLADCGDAHGSDYQGFFCPASNTALTATNESATTTANSPVSFNIGNGYALLNFGTNVFNNVGTSTGTGATAFVDWGLPFFFGKSVYVGIDGTTSSLGTGPYWAY